MSPKTGSLRINVCLNYQRIKVKTLPNAFTETMATTHGVIKKINVSFAYLYFDSSGIRIPGNCNSYYCGIIKTLEIVKTV